MTTSGTSKFLTAMSGTVGRNAHMVLGENGSHMYSNTGVSDPGREIQGAFVAAFNGIVEGATKSTIIQLFNRVINSINSNTTISGELRATYLSDLVVLIFQTRNIRGNGKGRRDFAYWMYLELYSHYPRTMIALLPELVEQGSWLDFNKMIELCCTDKVCNGMDLDILVDEMVRIYVTQIKQDISEVKDSSGASSGEKKDVSLAVKWVPKENRSLDKKVKITKRIVKEFSPGLFAQGVVKAMRAFRRAYAPVQDAINTTEKLECAKKYDEIKFNLVPGKTMFKKKKAYLYEKKKGSELRGRDPIRLKCRENLLKHLVDAKSGKTKINGKTMYLHELASYVYSNWANLSDADKLITDAQFEEHVKHFKELEKTTGCEAGGGVVCADVSGSMAGDPMAASVSLAILVGRLQKDIWKNKFISFETHPRWIELIYPETEEEFDALLTRYSGTSHNNLGVYTNILGTWDETRAGGELTFCESVGIVYTSPWGGSTDYVGVHELLLDICLKNKLTEADLPKWILTASDMQFDTATRPCSVRQAFHPTLATLCNDRQYSNAVGGRVSHGISTKILASSANDDHYNILKRAWKEAGLISEGKPWEIPMSIFWNMRSTGTHIAKENTLGVQMLGGFSTNQLKIFLEEGDLDPKVPNKPTVTPWDTFQTAVYSGDYRVVREIIESTAEGEFTNYIAPILETAGEDVGGESKSCSGSDSDSTDSSMPGLVSYSGSGSDSTDSSMPGLVPIGSPFSDTCDNTPVKSDVASSVSQPTGSFGTEVETKLKKMKSLLDQGLIDQSDYDSFKSGVLSDM